jgi:hypothetical protein
MLRSVRAQSKNANPKANALTTAACRSGHVPRSVMKDANATAAAKRAAASPSISASIRFAPMSGADSSQFLPIG